MARRVTCPGVVLRRPVGHLAEYALSLSHMSRTQPYVMLWPVQPQAISNIAERYGSRSMARNRETRCGAWLCMSNVDEQRTPIVGTARGWACAAASHAVALSPAVGNGVSSSGMRFSHTVTTPVTLLRNNVISVGRGRGSCTCVRCAIANRRSLPSTIARTPR